MIICNDDLLKLNYVTSIKSILQYLQKTHYTYKLKQHKCLKSISSWQFVSALHYCIHHDFVAAGPVPILLQCEVTW